MNNWQAREVAGLSVRQPDWPPASRRSADVAVVLHVVNADGTRIEAYLDALAGESVDLFVVVPVGASIEFDSPAGIHTEILEADPVGRGLYQLTAVLSSGRLTGYSTVVRHVEDSDEALARFVALTAAGGLSRLDSALRTDLGLAGYFVPDGTSTSARSHTGQRDVAKKLYERLTHVMSRVSTRFRELSDDSRSLDTIALRGALLEGLGTLQIDHQDFYFRYIHYLDQGLATESMGGTEPDDLAEEAIRLAFLALLDYSGMRFAPLDAEWVAHAPRDVVRARRAEAWAVYHADLTSRTAVRNASWTHLAASGRMYPGQNLPPVPTSLGFPDPSVAADRARQLALARENGITGFLVLSSWDEAGLQPREFFESVLSDVSFPWAIVLRHPALYRTDPASTQARVSAWSDPGPEFYASVAQSVSALASGTSYLRLEGRPVIVVDSPEALTDPMHFVDVIRSAVRERVGVDPWVAVADSFATTAAGGGHSVPPGFDGVVQLDAASFIPRIFTRLAHRLNGFTGPAINLSRTFEERESLAEARTNDNFFPAAVVAFDTTPVLRSQGTAGYQWNVMLFRRMLERAISSVAGRESSRRVVIVDSWNGWSDLSQLEPSRSRGASYLSAVREALFL